MESMYQQNSPLDDIVHLAPSSLTSDEEFHDSQSTQKSSISQDQQEDQTQDSPSRRCNDILKSADLQIMVQNYKQIGGELVYNLKILENKRQTLNKKLTDTSHECEILCQQKEFQMKALVDLQIKLENLDMERVKILKENQEDKTYKTEIFTHQLQSLLENDHYLRTTYDKFFEVLTTEKQNFENSLNRSRREKELNKKAGEAYTKEMNAIMKNFRREYEDLVGRETKLFVELDQVMVNCKNVIAEEVSLQNEKETHERELINKNDKHCSLNSLFIQMGTNKNTSGRLPSSKPEKQKSKSLTEAQEKLAENKEIFTEKLNNINQNIAELKLECDSISEVYEQKSKDLSGKTTILEALRKDADELQKNFSEAESNKALKEQELSLLIEEFNLLSTQLNTEKTQQVSLEAEAAELPIYQDNLNKLSAVENELQFCLEKLLEEEEAQAKDLESININEQFIKEKCYNIQKELEEWETKVKEAEREESDLIELCKKHNLDSENLLSEKKKESTELTLEIENNKSHENKLGEEINLTENQINDVEKKLQELMEEDSVLDKDDSDLKTQEEEIEIFREKVSLLENELTVVDSELEDLIKRLSGVKEIDELEAEIKRIDLEIKEATLHYKGQNETIESSFLSQTKNLEDKCAKDMSDLERRRAKGEARTKKMTEAVPQLNREIIKLESDLKKLLPNFVKEIGKTLQTLEEIADYYEKSQMDNKKRGLRGSTVRNLTAIEEHFAKPMKSMMSLEGMPKVDFEVPSSHKYKLVITAFREKYAWILNQVDKNPPLEMVEKLQELGSCVLGKKWVKPTYSQVLNDAEISSSTTEIFY